MTHSLKSPDSHPLLLESASQLLQFGEFTVDLDRKELFHGDKLLHLRPQSFDVLRYLVEHQGRLVEKQELLQAIWGDTEVTEDSLTHCIIDIRKAIGDTERTIIHTVPRRGFVFEAHVEQAQATAQFRDMVRSYSVRWPGLVTAFTVAASVLLIVLIQDNQPAEIATDDALPDLAATSAKDLNTLARFLINRRAPGDVEMARQYFEDAIEKDPESPDALAGLAGALAIEWHLQGEDDPLLLAKLKVAAERALKLDSNHIEGLLWLSRYYIAIGDQQNGDRLIRMAADIDASAPLLLGMKASDAAVRGDLETAIELQRRALDSEPLSFVHRGNLSHFLFAAGKYQMALEENRRAYQINSLSDGLPNRLQGYSLILLERYEEAVRLADVWPESPERDAVIAMASFKLGHLKIAATSLQRLKAESSAAAFLHRAEIFAFCQHIENAFQSLAALRDHLLKEQASEALLRDLHDELESSPFLAGLRADERWQEWVVARPLVVASAHAE